MNRLWWIIMAMAFATLAIIGVLAYMNERSEEDALVEELSGPQTWAMIGGAK